MNGVSWIKVIGIAASIVTTLATLAGDWAKKKQDEEAFDKKFDEKFDERFARMNEVKDEEE